MAFKIDPEKTYAFKDLIDHKVFKGVPQTYGSYRNFVTQQSKHLNLLPIANTSGGKGRAFVYKGEDIIAFINKIH